MVAPDPIFILGAAREATTQIGTSTPERRKHDLEDHIEILRELDGQRRKSAELRDYGIEVLTKAVPWWLEQGGDGRAKHKKALLYRLIDCFSRHSVRKDEAISALIGGEPGNFFSALKLQEISRHQAPVSFAGSGLQACVATPGMGYSKASLLCYYYIAREMYIADAPPLGHRRGSRGSRTSAGRVASRYSTMRASDPPFHRTSGSVETLYRMSSRTGRASPKT